MTFFAFKANTECVFQHQQPSYRRSYTFIKIGLKGVYTSGPKCIFSFPASTVVSCLTKSQNSAQMDLVNAGEEDTIHVILIKLLRTYERI